MQRIIGEIIETHEENLFLNESVEFENCLFKGKGNIVIEDLSMSFIRCSFHAGLRVSYGLVKFRECKFNFIGKEALYLENKSNCHLENCEFSRNGSEEYFSSQIFCEHSLLYVKNSHVRDSINASGIEAVNSDVSIFDIVCENNSGCGIDINGGLFRIDNGIFGANGSLKGNFNQIVVRHSTGTLKNVDVLSGENSGGVSVEGNSKVDIMSSTLKNNPGNGIAVCEMSSCNIKDSLVEANGDEFEDTLQIWVDGSSLSAKGCRIVGGHCGVYAQKNSLIKLEDCEISKNTGGVCLFEFSDLTMSNCIVAQNVGKPQVYAEESKLKIENSKFTGDGKFIYAYGMREVVIRGTILDNEKVHIINSSNVEF